MTRQTATPPCGEPIIRAEHLTRIDSKNTILLHPASLSVYAGDHIALTGPSGAGKSVFLRTLALLEPPHQGRLWFHGQEIKGPHVPAYRSKVAYIPQRPGLFPGTVEDNLKLPFTLRAHHDQHYQRERAIDLLHYCGRDGGFLDKASQDLSGGEAQIMAIIRTLQLNPQVLLLDEPTSALDPQSVEAIEALLQDWFAQQSPMVASCWITHNVTQAQRVANRFMVMQHGQLGEAPTPAGESHE